MKMLSKIVRRYAWSYSKHLLKDFLVFMAVTWFMTIIGTSIWIFLLALGQSENVGAIGAIAFALFAVPFSMWRIPAYRNIGSWQSMRLKEE